MATFPDTIQPEIESYKVALNWKTLKMGMTDGDFLQRRKKRTTPLHTFTMNFRPITAAEMQTLWEFYQARSGSYEAFVFFDYKAFPYTDVSVGTGTGAALTCQLKAKSVSSLVVKVAGVTKTAGVDYSFTSDGSGTNGQDKIVFLAGKYPTAGQAVTASYTGRKYLQYMIFQDDAMSRDQFHAVLFQTGITITEVTG